MIELPFNASADRNKQAIAEALAEYLLQATTVLEIGSGTGQHALHLCQQFSHLQWQLTDQKKYLEGLRAVVEQSQCNNLLLPIELEVSSYVVGENQQYSFAYSANTAHIMSLPQVSAMFDVIGSLLSAAKRFALYGPFKEHGQHNSDGNRQFDLALRSEDPKMGIRDISALEGFATENGLVLETQIAMPANNRVLLWRKC